MATAMMFGLFGGIEIQHAYALSSSALSWQTRNAATRVMWLSMRRMDFILLDPLSRWFFCPMVGDRFQTTVCSIRFTSCRRWQRCNRTYRASRRHLSAGSMFGLSNYCSSQVFLDFPFNCCGVCIHLYEKVREVKMRPLQVF